MRSWLLGAMLVLAGCREQGLQGSTGTLRLSPSRVDFGPALVGQQTRTQTLQLLNDGRSTLPLHWTLPSGGFFFDTLPTEAPSGVTEITARFTPAAAGLFNRVLAVDSGGTGLQQVLLAGEGREIPQCPGSDSCHQASFDLEFGACVEHSEPDGTECNRQGNTKSLNACLVNATCQAGRCVGTAKSCDDSNACTLDSCNPVAGCEHLPAPPCPGDGKCQVGICNPATGCGMASASDGTACGPIQTCDAAEVCIAGNCVLRDPPDGYVCAEASPCQPQGICAGSSCARPPAVTLAASWAFDSAQTGDPDAGIAADQLHDLVLENNGAVTLSGFFQAAPQLRANTSQAKPASEGSARRCMLWNGRLICADYPAAVNGKVAAIDLASGATLWSFDLRAARPDFMALTQSLFMARMAVQGSDRLAALFEAYPKSADPTKPTNCRLYFLVVLDASGALVTAEQVLDPVLSVCNHPHPYGFGADSLGDLFISFSPTISSPAPLVPGSPTLVMSYTRDGIFRWKFTDFSLVGGELAVARGLLYPENSAIAILTSSGQPAFALTELYGRAVITQQRTVVAPVVGGLSLNGYESGTNTPRWKHRLGSGQFFGSDQVRLSSWSTSRGPQTVALTFTRQAGHTQLHGIVARDGVEAFTCDVSGINLRSEPQLFEVANGSIALMEGSDACGKCDPPYAGSSAAFHTLQLPTISVSTSEPWVGTFGGAGHDHREEQLSEPPDRPAE